MKQALLTILSVLLLTTVVCAQKKSTLFGDAWEGVVESADEATREIKLVNPEKKTEFFVGFLVNPYIVKFNDGTSEEFQFRTIKLGMRLRAFYKAKTEDAAGQKKKYNLINKLQLLGHDDYTRLRHLLKLDPSTPVIVDKSLKLPSKSPLNLLFALEPQGLDIAMIQWVHQWNALQSAEYGRIEIVDDPAQADATVVVIWGKDDSYVNPTLPAGNSSGAAVAFATVYLVTKDASGLRVGWEDLTVVEAKLPMTFVGFGKGLEKKLKARSK